MGFSKHRATAHHQALPTQHLGMLLSWAFPVLREVSGDHRLHVEPMRQPSSPELTPHCSKYQFFLAPIYELPCNVLVHPITWKRVPSRSNNQLCLIAVPANVVNHPGLSAHSFPISLPFSFTPASQDLHSWKKELLINYSLRLCFLRSLDSNKE